MRYAIIQLARRGDIVNALPVAHHLHARGHEIDWWVWPAFAEMLEPCSYVNPVPWGGGHRDVWAAHDAAVATGRYDEVLVTQVDGNDRPAPVETENFITQSWARAGFLPQFHDLPLVFDRRDREGEAAAIKALVPPDDGRPLLAFCLIGHSSPYNPYPDTRRWVLDTFGERFRLCELSREPLPRCHHLLGPLELADALITIDTLPLHLAYAFGTPTIALSRDVAWYQSEPRRHWLARYDYRQSTQPRYRAEIADLLLSGDVRSLRGRHSPLARDMGRVERERCFQVVDWHVPKKPADKERVLAARKTWEALAYADGHWEIAWHEVRRHARRTSRDLGDGRNLPFVRDLFDHAAAAADAAGLPDAPIVFTNADVALTGDAADMIRAKLRDGPCCYSRRVDVPDICRVHTRDELAKFRAHVGADLFACRASWWRAHRDELPDLLHACEGWDFVARHVWRRHNPAAEIAVPIVYHERHAAYWTRPENILRNPGQRHNRELATRWAREVGLGYMLREQTEKDPYLFRGDEHFRGYEPTPEVAAAEAVA